MLNDSDSTYWNEVVEVVCIGGPLAGRIVRMQQKDLPVTLQSLMPQELPIVDVYTSMSELINPRDMQCETTTYRLDKIGPMGALLYEWEGNNSKEAFDGPLRYMLSRQL